MPAYADVCYICRSLSCHLLATCNSDSLLRVFRYPCVVTGAEENLSGKKKNRKKKSVKKIMLLLFYPLVVTGAEENLSGKKKLEKKFG
jgi:hypothetical protein